MTDARGAKPQKIETRTFAVRHLADTESRRSIFEVRGGSLPGLDLSRRLKYNCSSPDQKGSEHFYSACVYDNSCMAIADQDPEANPINVRWKTAIVNRESIRPETDPLERSPLQLRAIGTVAGRGPTRTSSQCLIDIVACNARRHVRLVQRTRWLATRRAEQRLGRSWRLEARCAGDTIQGDCAQFGRCCGASLWL